MSEILLAAVRRRGVGGAPDRTGPSFRSFRRFLIRKAEASRRALKALEKKKKKTLPLSRCHLLLVERRGRSAGRASAWRRRFEPATFKSVQTQQWGGRGGKAEPCVNVHTKIMGFSRSSIRAENKVELNNSPAFPPVRQADGSFRRFLPLCARVRFRAFSDI